MDHFYNIDEIMQHLGQELKEAAASREKWAAVTFPTKKDGTPYAVITKNITGATYKPENDYLYICTQVNYKYITDYAYIKGDAGQLENIKNAVRDRIVYLDKKINSLNTQIENVKKDFATLENAYKELTAAKKALYEKYADNTSFYAIDNTLNYKYQYEYRK